MCSLFCVLTMTFTMVTYLVPTYVTSFYKMQFTDISVMHTFPQKKIIFLIAAVCHSNYVYSSALNLVDIVPTA